MDNSVERPPAEKPKTGRVAVFYLGLATYYLVWLGAAVFSVYACFLVVLLVMAGGYHGARGNEFDYYLRLAWFVDGVFFLILFVLPLFFLKAARRALGISRRS